MKIILASLFSVFLGFSAWAAAPAAPAGAVRIGVAAALKGRVEALPSAARTAGRVLAGGDAIFLNDKISTDAKGRLQVILLDETVFTLGPNSTMVLDSFVYNPETGAGEASADVVKGYFRFITGKVGKKNPGKFKVKVPVGTLGVFGTIVSGKVEGGETTVVLDGPGAGNNASEKAGRVIVEDKSGGAVTLSRPGYSVTIGQKGISGSFKASPELLAGISGALLPKMQKPGKAKEVNADYQAAEDSSGQDSASGRDYLASVKSVSELGAALATAGDDAVGGGLGDVFSGMTEEEIAATTENYLNPRWEDIRRIQGSATLAYNGGYGSFMSPGSVCNGGVLNCMGSWGYSLDINFDSRSIAATAYMTSPNINDALGTPTPVTINYSASSGIATFTRNTEDIVGGSYTWTFANAGLNTHDVSVNGTCTFNAGGDTGASVAEGLATRD